MKRNGVIIGVVAGLLILGFTIIMARPPLAVEVPVVEEVQDVEDVEAPQTLPTETKKGRVRVWPFVDIEWPIDKED